MSGSDITWETAATADMTWDIEAGMDAGDEDLAAIGSYTEQAEAAFHGPVP